MFPDVILGTTLLRNFVDLRSKWGSIGDPLEAPRDYFPVTFNTCLLEIGLCFGITFGQGRHMNRILAFIQPRLATQRGAANLAGSRTCRRPLPKVTQQ